VGSPDVIERARLGPLHDTVADGVRVGEKRLANRLEA
jgi:hypothetical protein